MITTGIGRVNLEGIDECNKAKDPAAAKEGEDGDNEIVVWP